MKHSIAQVFKNLSFMLLIIFFLSTLTTLFIIEQYFSYEKIDSLKKQEKILTTIIQKQRETQTYSIIEYNGEIAGIYNQIENLQKENSYYYLSSLVINDFSEQNKGLQQLKELVQDFDKQARNYFDSLIASQQKNQFIDQLSKKHVNVKNHINWLSLNNAECDKKRFMLLATVYIFSFLLLSVITFLYSYRLRRIYKDIIYLFNPKQDKADRIYTQEVDAISLRFKRKSVISDDPSMIDPVTEIHNNKGMVQAYSERKSFKNNNFNSVTVIEIDNFSKSKRTYSQELTQLILQKVAYTISLHQQATDIIARSDYNQFTLIFSRPSKSELFKHIELVQQSISEIRLSNSEKEKIKITVTGGFINKEESNSLEDSIRKAKTLLGHARQMGSDRIIQLKDVPRSIKI